MIRRRNLLGGLAVSLLATGCSRLPKPTPVSVLMIADANINPNELGEPSPLVIRVYELKGVKAFNNATYFDFVDDDAKTLGADLIASQEYELTPGEEEDYKREISSEATHLGVVAGFRNIQSATWRTSVELKKSKKNQFAIYITSLAVRIQKMRRRRLGVL
jgi:type VI secretion system protein VasD